MRHPRADGGDGGNGGDIMLRADANVPTLLDLAYRKHVRAQAGKHASSKRQRGADGIDLVVPVPPGTLVYDDATDELLRDLEAPGEMMVVARGGQGGVGNAHRREITLGELGEERRIRLELKLVADVGIVGLPNAGKSSLLRAISAARPRVAAFPFTTLIPALGAVRLSEDAPPPDVGPLGRPSDAAVGGRSGGGATPFVAVDVPGLIEGASRGRGLGLGFLRHIERTRLLWHLVDMAGVEGRDPVDDFRVLNQELAQYNQDVADKPQILVANKMDLPGARQALTRFKRAIKQPVMPVSAKTGDGVAELLKATEKLLRKLA